MAIRFDYFIGVDQTGAVLPGGQRAKPLSACVLVRQKEKSWKLITESSRGKSLKLDRFTEEALLNFLAQAGIRKDDLSGVGLMVDCVFGLSREVFRGKKGSAIWKLIQTTNDIAVEGALYGRPVAEKFFSKIWSHRPGQALPTRQCETISKVNSVFLIRPYQKNIQTGTFRIWRDIALSSAEKWLNFWPFEDRDSADPSLPWIFEGYPSLLWRTVLGQPVRKPAALQGAVAKLSEAANRAVRVRADSWQHLAKDPDLADAAVLAIGGAILQEQGRLFEPFPNFKKIPGLRTEGWIAGLSLGGDVCGS